MFAALREIVIARLASASACIKPGLPFPENSVLAEQSVIVALKYKTAVITLGQGP